MAFSTERKYLDAINKFYLGKHTKISAHSYYRCCNYGCNTTCLKTASSVKKWPKALYFLIKGNYVMNQKHFDHYIVNVTKGKSQSLFVNSSGWRCNCFYTTSLANVNILDEITSYMFMNFDPTEKQLIKMIACYEKAKSNINKGWVEILNKKGFKFSKAIMDKLVACDLIVWDSKTMDIEDIKKQGTKMKYQSLLSVCRTVKPDDDLFRLLVSAKGATVVDLLEILYSHKIPLTDEYAKLIFNKSFIQQEYMVRDIAYALKSNANFIKFFKNNNRLTGDFIDHIIDIGYKEIYGVLVYFLKLEVTVEQMKKYFTLKLSKKRYYSYHTHYNNGLNTDLFEYLKESGLLEKMDIGLYNLLCYTMTVDNLKKILKITGLNPNLETITNISQNKTHLQLGGKGKQPYIEFVEHLLQYKMMLEPTVVTDQTCPFLLPLFIDYGLDMDYKILEKICNSDISQINMNNLEDYKIKYGYEVFHILHVTGCLFDISFQKSIIKKIKENPDVNEHQIELRLMCRNGKTEEIQKYVEEHNLNFDRYCMEIACTWNRNNFANYLLDIQRYEPPVRALWLSINKTMTDLTNTIYKRMNTDLSMEELSKEY